MERARSRRAGCHMCSRAAGLGDQPGLLSPLLATVSSGGFLEAYVLRHGCLPRAFFPWPEPDPKSPTSVRIRAAKRSGRGWGGPLPAWVGQARQLPSLLAAESLPGCGAQGPGSVTGNISYYNAELGTQSLLKINTKENPKVAKPISIPFIFLVPGSFVFPLQV